MIHGIDHASFTVSNMEQSIAFYCDILGMHVVWDSKVEGVRFCGPGCDKVTGCPGSEQRLVFLALGTSRLELVEFTPPGKPLQDNKTSDIGAAHICFRTDNIQATYNKLLSQGITIHCEPQHMGFGWIFYFRDPDGIILEISQDDPTE
jgi:glyoxylase I family protein